MSNLFERYLVEKKDVENLLVDMVRSRYLAAVVPADFVNRIDREIAAEANEMSKFGTKIPTAKEEAEAKKRAKDAAEATSFDEHVQGLVYPYYALSLNMG